MAGYSLIHILFYNNVISPLSNSFIVAPASGTLYSSVHGRMPGSILYQSFVSK